MKSGGGLLLTAWLLLMAWCLFSNRVSTATVMGNGYLQVVTCKYLIFCSLDKYKLLVPHQVCAFAQKRLIELKSTLVGGARGFFSMGNANSRNQEKGVVFIFNFGKLNSQSLITQGDDMTYIHK